MGRWKELTREIEDLLRLRTFPIAYKALEKAADLREIPRVRRIDHLFTFCQATTLCRTAGWTIAIAGEDNMVPRCTQIQGLAHPNEQSALRFAGVWFQTEADAIKQFAALPKMPQREAIVVTPLASEKFDPEVILIYGTPAQMILLINGLQWQDYNRFRFFCSGESACADSVVECYLSGTPALAIPCYGERRFGHVQEDELALALPPTMLEKTIQGLRALQAVGIRYPIVPFGAEADPTPGFARAYPQLFREQGSTQTG